MTEVTAVIPAYNEGTRIETVLQETTPYADEILIVDDHSTDNTVARARPYGRVIQHDTNRGYNAALKTGFAAASTDIIVTLDADGEHDPADIPRLLEPIHTDTADLILGARSHIPRPSERCINRLTNLRVDVHDCGTGFRALKTELAQRLHLPGKCTCGTLVLEAVSHGARITEVPITTRTIDKPVTPAFQHIPQFFFVLKWLVPH